jgi:hypothetical protein
MTYKISQHMIRSFCTWDKIKQLANLQLMDTMQNIVFYGVTPPAHMTILNFVEQNYRLGCSAISYPVPLGCPRAVLFEALYMLMTSGRIDWKYNWRKLDHAEMKIVQEIAFSVENESGFIHFPSLQYLVPTMKPMIAMCIGNTLPLNLRWDMHQHNRLSYVVFHTLQAILATTFQESILRALAAEAGKTYVTFRGMQESAEDDSELELIEIAEFVQQVANYRKDTILGNVVIYHASGTIMKDFQVKLSELEIIVVPKILPSGFFSKTRMCKINRMRMASIIESEATSSQFPTLPTQQQREAGYRYPPLVKKWIFNQFEKEKSVLTVRDDLEDIYHIYLRQSMP